MADQYTNARTESFSITQFLVRVVVGAIVLAITAFLTPGFTIGGIWPLLLGAVVLAGLDYLITRFTRTSASPFGRGIVGFILAAVILYSIRYFVAGYDITLWGALLGALIYGIVDAIIPGKAM